MKHYIENHITNIDRTILDELQSKEDVTSLKLKITATHAGRINGNKVFYTPRSMREGVGTLVKPFNKHLQKGHNGKAVGVITDSIYIDHSDKYPELQDIYLRMENATTNQDLVSAVKDLVNHEIAQEDSFEGLGVTEVKATLYDKNFIKDLISGENQGKVSIGGESDNTLCSVCASPFRQNHRHKRGSTYNGEVCFAIYDKMTLDHVGFTSNPADFDTNTTILDNENIQDSQITIETYEIQDNLQGNKQNMKFSYQDLLAAAGSVDSLVSLYPEASEAKLAEIKTKLTSEIPTADSAFLLTKDKLLPINTQLGLVTAKRLVSKLDPEVAEKQILEDLINTQVELKFDGESIDDFITNLMKEEEETKKEGEVVSTAFTPESLDLFIEQVSEKVTEKLSGKWEQTQQGIKDSLDTQNYSLLIDRNKALEQDIRIISDSVDSLTDELKEVIIDRILEKKGLDRTSDYYTSVLTKRDIEQLKSTLEDLKFETSSTSSTTDLEKSNIEKTNIQDSLNKEKQTDKSKTPETIQDDLEDSSLSKQELIGKYGYAQGLKKFNAFKQGK